MLLFQGVLRTLKIKYGFILIVFNMSPRYFSRNNKTHIILDFILIIISIVVLTYTISVFIKRKDDGKEKKGETVPTIEALTFKRTLKPDSFESGTTEPYQVEYNNGGITDTELSKNVVIDITWSNKSGFNDVHRIDIEHYVTDPSAESKGSIKKTNYIHRYENDAKEGNEIEGNSKFFTNFESGLTHTFQGDGTTYSFVGKNTISIKAYYRETSSYLYNGDINNTGPNGDVALVSSSDLAATLDLTEPDVRKYNPIEGDFGVGDADIYNTPYYATSRNNIDIYKSVSGKTVSTPFTLMRASNLNKNQFYFKFSDNEYLGYESGNLTIKSKNEKQIITLVQSPLDNPDGERYFRLSFEIVIDNGNVPQYIVVDGNGNGVIKKMYEIASQDMYNMLEWKFTTDAASPPPPPPPPPPSVACPGGFCGNFQLPSGW